MTDSTTSIRGEPKLYNKKNSKQSKINYYMKIPLSTDVNILYNQTPKEYYAD